MGESAMLLRSFSHPSNASREAKEVDPIRALRESVSFGRFVSESLAWEKWSTFSHNRYLEEVEKFSKPGSVAEKKAYFEAHYKRKAAMKAAAFEEANSAANNVPELKTTSDIHNDCPMDAESAKTNSLMTINEQEEQYISNAKNDSSMDTDFARNSNVTIDEQWHKDAPDTEVADFSDANACNPISIRNDSENADLERQTAKTNSHMTINEQEEQYISNAENDSSMDTDFARNSNMTIDEQWHKDAPDTEVADSSDANACNPISIRNDSENADLERGVPLIEYGINVENPTEADNLEQLQNANDLDKVEATLSENVLNKEAVDQENLASSIKKKRSSWSLKSSTQSRASQLALLHPPRQAPSLLPRNVNSINCKKSVGGSSEKKRVVPKTLHMSINFTSLVTEASEGSLKKPKGCSTPTRTPIRASVNGVSKHLSKIFQSEDKRSKAIVNKSVSGGIAEDRKLHSTSMDGSKSSRINGSKTQSPNVSSPFSFRSEERAAKRKEFFQKLEEKSNAREAEKAQVETRSKGKAEHDIKKLRWSTSFGAKQNIYLNCGSNLPSSHVKKIPLTQPRSPKLRGKPTPTAVADISSRPPRKPSSNTESSKQGIERADRSTTRSTISLPKLVRKPTPHPVQDASSRPPWRSSMSTASFKRVMEKGNRSTTVSVTSLPKKTAHENASPNIQC